MNAQSEDPQDIQELAAAMEQLAKAMGESKRDRTMAEGRLMNLDDAVQATLNDIP